MGFLRRRKAPHCIRYICVSKKHEGRNLTFVPRAEGPWFVGAERRLRVLNLTFVPRAEGPWFVGAGRRLRVSKKHEGRNLTFVPRESGRDLPTTIPRSSPHTLANVSIDFAVLNFRY